MDKVITPNYQSERLTGCIGELRDGELLIHSMEYSTYSQAESALDALAFDILSDLATDVPADELPTFTPSTCVYCNGLHHPQSCPEMRAMLFAPDAPAPTRCATCGDQGDCPDCDPDAPACEICDDLGYFMCDEHKRACEYCQTGRIFASFASDIYPPLDVDFAPVGPEV